jgi:peptide methionine sulfoxide reductase MsrA
MIRIRLTYEKLVGIFLQSIDPTDSEGQFFDQSPSYRTGIYYGNEEEKEIALRALKELDASGRFEKPVAVEVLPATQVFTLRKGIIKLIRRITGSNLKLMRSGRGE